MPGKVERARKVDTNHKVPKIKRVQVSSSIDDLFELYYPWHTDIVLDNAYPRRCSRTCAVDYTTQSRACLFRPLRRTLHGILDLLVLRDINPKELDLPRILRSQLLVFIHIEVGNVRADFQ